MNAQDILSFARDLKEYWNTNDPFEIADILGIEVLKRDFCNKAFTAQTVKVPGYPTIISINNSYTEFSQKVLCAHELGHALLHQDCINHFATTNKNRSTAVEYEANLFAVALLGSNDLENSLTVPLTKMSNYLLKSILDANIHPKDEF